MRSLARGNERNRRARGGTKGGSSSGKRPAASLARRPRRPLDLGRETDTFFFLRFPNCRSTTLIAHPRRSLSSHHRSCLVVQFSRPRTRAQSPHAAMGRWTSASHSVRVHGTGTHRWIGRRRATRPATSAPRSRELAQLLRDAFRAPIHIRVLAARSVYPAFLVLGSCHEGAL